VKLKIMATKVSAGTHLSIPSWFRLSKYKGLGNLDLVGWYRHLSVRQHCMRAVGPDRDFWLELTPTAFDSTSKILNLLRVNPLSEDKLFDEVMSSQMSDFLPENISHTLGVHSLTMSDLCDQLAAINEEKRCQLCSYGDLSVAWAWEFNLRNRDWISQEVYAHQRDGTREHLLAVDLSLSQDVLVNQFRDWLSGKQREKRPGRTKVKYHAPDPRKWLAVNLLPCMDLMLWAAEKDIHFSKRDLTKAIQANGLARESATAKTTIPLAQDFLNQGKRSSMLLRRLRVAAATELVEIERAAVIRKGRLESRK
jgi:hypothetical protein